MRLIKDACFPSVMLESLLENALDSGIDDEDGRWSFPKVTASVNRDYITGRKLIPKKNAKDIRNHFVNSGDFIEAYDELLEVGGTRNRILDELESKGIEGLNQNNLSEKLFILFQIFLSAFEHGTDRISTDLPRSELETNLLNEVHYLCPKCRKQQLVIKLDDSYMAEYYDVYDIFPKDQLLLMLPSGECIPPPAISETIDNKIVLCKKHHKKLEEKAPSDSYLLLSRLKEKIILASATLAKSDAQEIIELILSRINVPQGTEKRELRIDPLPLEKKIGGAEDHLLYERVFSQANQYYESIREMLSELDDTPKKIWSQLASYILSFYKENANFDHYTIYSVVTERLLGLSALEKTEKNKMACGYITSFFIQNCEVFDEITE